MADAGGKTGPTASGVAYNFGDTTAGAAVAGAARPGAKAQKCFSEAKADPTTAAEVQEWVSAMKAHGVQAVVSLLSPEEAETYAAPGVDAAMRAAFGDGNYFRFNLKDAGAASPAAVMAAIESQVKAGHKVLVHCWGGGGRTGLVQAAWLARARGLSAADAAAAVGEHAKALGVPRRVDVAALEAFLAEAGSA